MPNDASSRPRDFFFPSRRARRSTEMRDEGVNLYALIASWLGVPPEQVTEQTMESNLLRLDSKLRVEREVSAGLRVRLRRLQIENKNLQSEIKSLQALEQTARGNEEGSSNAGAGPEDDAPAPPGRERHAPASAGSGGWCKIFPWLCEEGAAHIRTRLDGDGGGSADEDLALIVEHLCLEAPDWPIAQVFPHVPERLPMLFLPLESNTRNVLEWAGIMNIQELLPKSVGSVEALMGADRDALHGLFKALTKLSVIELRSAGHEIADPDFAPEPSDEAELAASVEEYLPPVVLSGPELTAAQVISIGLRRMRDPRARMILRERVFADKPATLEELGAAANVTRERIRQIELNTLSALRTYLEDPRVLDLRSRAVAASDPVVALDTLVAQLPELGAVVPELGVPVWALLSKTEGALESDGTWCAAETLAGAKEATLAELSGRADAHGVVALEDLRDGELSGVRESELCAWLEHIGVTCVNGHAYMRTRSLPDWAAGALSASGRAMSAQEILDWFSLDRSVRSLRNALAQDPRLQRVDKDKWALTEWGLETYTSIRDAIAAVIEEHGGQVLLPALMEAVSKRFSVAPNSVAAYASAWPFETVNGVVRKAAEPRKADADPADAVSFYRRGDDWLYRVAVTPDHLRGSGSPCPLAAASLVGLSEGDQVALPSILGDQWFYWTGLNPSCATLRRFVQHLNLEVGEQMFLGFRGDGSFFVERVEDAEGDSLAQALALVGAPAHLKGREARTVLGRTLALDEGEDLGSIARAYFERGDADVGELLRAKLMQDA